MLSKKIKILAINPMDTTYGSTHRFRKLIEGIASDERFSLTYVEPNSELPQARTFKQGNNFLGFLWGNLMRSFYCLFAGYDCLIIQTITPLTVPCVLIARIKRKKVVVDWDDLSWMLQKSAFRSFLVRACEHNFIGLATLVTVPNRYLAEYGRQYGAREIEYVSHGIDTALFNPQFYQKDTVRRIYEIPKGNYVLGYLASFTTGGVKDLDFIFGCVKKVIQDDSKVSLLVIGGGPLFDCYERLAKSMAISNIYFTGWLPQSKIPLHLAAVDMGLIFMRPDLANQYKTSLKVAEYLAMHKPVVGFLVGESADNFNRFCILSKPEEGSFVSILQASLTKLPAIDWPASDAFLKDNYSWENSSRVFKQKILSLI